MTDFCIYKYKHSDSYGTNWKTTCGETVRMETPIEVGMSPTPLPNAYGKYCHYCGKLIKVKEQKND